VPLQNFSTDSAQAWADALSAAQIAAFSGVGVRLIGSSANPAREVWMRAFEQALKQGHPNAKNHLVRVPCQISHERLVGGIDLAATLASGSPKHQIGLLDYAQDGALVLAMAERLSANTASVIAAAIDNLASLATSKRQFVPVALDEGVDDEQIHEALRQRLPIEINLALLPIQASDIDDPASAVNNFYFDYESSLACASVVRVDQAYYETAILSLDALGIASIRCAMGVIDVAKANAAIDGRAHINEGDFALATRLVLAPRATQMPQIEPAPETEADQSEPESDSNQAPDSHDNDFDEQDNQQEHSSNEDDQSESNSSSIDEPLPDQILQAALATLPNDVLAALGAKIKKNNTSSGSSGAKHRNAARGRVIGSERSAQTNARVHILHTLRAAAPWQKIRRLEKHALGSIGPRLDIRKDDLRFTRREQANRSTMIFVVDASGSAALHRLSEAKGAVELLLAKCYVRRDQVALISFRGMSAQIVLQPTKSLARAKRSLSAMPAGGGTPIALAIDAACELALQIYKKGETPFVVMLTDGRANITREGKPGREQSQLQAIQAAKQFALNNFTALLIDTGSQAQAGAQTLAASMCARYIALPYADAGAISRTVQAALR
jgi:magnesium chelatase subunit D